MNKIFRKAVVQLVDEGMASRFPDFTLDKFDKNPLRRAGDREFVWSPAEGCRIYICVMMHHSGWDSFYNEIRWSRLGRYPHLRAEVYTRESIGVDEAFIPVGELCDRPWSWKIERQHVPPPANPLEEFDDYRGLTEQEAVQLVRPLVEDMFLTLDRCGRQFIDELAGLMRGERAAC
jgi:hypothetical protein